MNDLLEIGEKVLVNKNPIDIAERELLDLPQIECPVDHIFAPGFYIRVFNAPKGAFIVSKIHKQVNLFSITKGSVIVWDEKTGVSEYKSGDMGITHPGTRRVLYVQEDLTWVTSHSVFTEDLDEIEKILIEDKKNPFMSDEENEVFSQIKRFHSQKKKCICE